MPPIEKANSDRLFLFHKLLQYYKGVYNLYFFPVYDYGSSGVGGSSEADTKLYCYCQSPHDDVSEMIGCDAPGCKLEWFHFECVGIMIPPEGEWFCPDCAKKYKIK